MSDYNVNNNMLNEPENKKPNYTMAILAGLGVSFIVAIALAVIGIWLEAEYTLALALGGVFIGLVIRNFVPKKSIAGAIIGAILCPATYLLYQVIIAMYGYYLEGDENTIWFMLGGGLIYGAYMGYNNDND